ncbi:MAG TPA: DUF5946 family protein [Gemmatimonadaceae bacterium]|nr:DUF5946 family protein [Gemmatimonadaceae bacterium]
MHTCAECGASYLHEGESCVTRFERLLALDHSRSEPWGSRHGQAFAAFALQHPARYGKSLDAAWTLLFRIYECKEPPTRVIASLRHPSARDHGGVGIPARPQHQAARPGVTIADLGEFAADVYPRQLDEWCQATLRAWEHASAWPRPNGR